MTGWFGVWRGLAAGRARSARSDGDERGTTLMEMVVGMAIMVIFMSIFTGSVVMLIRTSSHDQSVVTTTNNLDSAFFRFDKSVRYSASISSPGTSSASGYWYVEVLTSNTGSSVCTQFRVNTATSQLQSRSWTVVGSSYATLTSWTSIAGGITNGNATSGSTNPPVPFKLITAGTANYEQLAVNLVSTTGNPAVSTSIGLTFIALNSATALQAANNNATYASGVCNQVSRP